MPTSLKNLYSKASFILYVSGYGLGFAQGQKPLFGTVAINPSDAGTGLRTIPQRVAIAGSRAILPDLDSDYEAHLLRADALGYAIPTEPRQLVENDFIIELKALVPNIVNGGITMFLMTDGDTNYSLLNVWPRGNTGFFDKALQENQHGIFVSSIGWFASPVNEPQLRLLNNMQAYYPDTENAFMLSVIQGDDTVNGDFNSLQNLDKKIYTCFGRITKTVIAPHLFTEAPNGVNINLVSSPNNKKQVNLVNNNYVAPDYKFASRDVNVLLQGDRTTPIYVDVPIDFSGWAVSNPTYIAVGNGFIEKILTGAQNQYAEQTGLTWLGKRLSQFITYTIPNGVNNTNGPRIDVTDGVNTDSVWLTAPPSAQRFAPYLFNNINAPNGWINTANGEVIFNFTGKTVRIYPTKTGIDSDSRGGVRFYFQDLVETPIDEVIFPNALLFSDYQVTTNFQPIGTNWNEVWWNNSGGCITVEPDKKTLTKAILNCPVGLRGYAWGAGTALKFSSPTGTYAQQDIRVTMNGDGWRWNQDTDTWLKVQDAAPNPIIKATFFKGGIIVFSRLDGQPLSNSLTSGDVLTIIPDNVNPALTEYSVTVERVANKAVPLDTISGSNKLFVYGGTLDEADEVDLIAAAKIVTDPFTTPPADQEVPNLLTFRRETSGTRINENNQYSTGAIDLPRLDYYESISKNVSICAARCPVLLFEPRRTNFVENSSRFPYTLNEFEQLLFEIDNIHQGRTYTAGLAYLQEPIKTVTVNEQWNGSNRYAVTVSFYVKFIETVGIDTVIGFKYDNGLGFEAYFFLDALTGQPATGFQPNTGDVMQYGSQKMGNEFYRVWVRFGDSAVYGTGTYSIGYLNQVAELLVNQLQIEASDTGCYVPTNPIFTLGGSATREADQAIMTDIYQKEFLTKQDEGSFYMEFMQLDGSLEFGGSIADGLGMPVLVDSLGEGLKINLVDNYVEVQLNSILERLPITQRFNRLFFTWRNGRARLLLNNKQAVTWVYSVNPQAYFFNATQFNVNYYDLVDRADFRFALRALMLLPDYYPEMKL